MRAAHNIVISVFAKEGESEEEIKRGLLNLIPIDLEKEKVAVEEKTAAGFDDKRIRVFEVRLERERHVRRFLENLMSKLNERQKDLLIGQLDSRVDEECNFFIRLDKEKLLNGEYWVTDSGDCYHIKTLVASYPAKKERAKGIIKRLVEG
ncbi:hypothetical protein KY345_03150 [Candidatus Woesearchaeota archaeon]|nr:hypothetical protein [Candidatus Woesearchaeota archaeon]